MSLSYFFVPAPIDGLNLRNSPYNLSPTEAQQLDNYLVFDWGIRETGAFTSLTHPTSGTIGQLIFFTNQNGTATQLICVGNKVYSTTSATWGSPTDLTGALTITSNSWRHAFWKKRVFMVNATDVGLIYDIAGATLAADTWTGLTTDNASQVFSFKQRLYYVKKASTSVYYGGVGGVSGALTEYDVSSFFEHYGTILFGTSWSVNQGNYNEQLFVLVSSAGEILVYSGDSPAADNWALVTRVTIPTPIGNQAFIRLGQDLLISTVRGVVSLATVIAGRQDEERYFNISGKIADQFGISVNVPPIRDPRRPFIYFASSSAQYIYVLNFERGAWSRLDTTIGSGTISAMSFFDQGTVGNYLNVSFSNSTSKLMDDSTGNTVAHAWRTGFLGVEPNKVKQVEKVRAIGRNTAGTSQFVNTIACRFDNLTDNTASDTKSASTSSTNYLDHELAPVGIGRRPSLIFSKTSTGEQNELVGCDVFYTQIGGVD